MVRKYPLCPRCATVALDQPIDIVEGIALATLYPIYGHRRLECHACENVVPLLDVPEWRWGAEYDDEAAKKSALGNRAVPKRTW